MKLAIQEYADWNNGETFENNPIRITRDHYRIVQSRKICQRITQKKSGCTEPERTKRGDSINHRKMENAPARKSTQQITGCSRQQWYATNMAIPKKDQDGKHKQPSYNKEKDGTDCQGLEEMLARWGEWKKGTSETNKKAGSRKYHT